jgi:crotonobetainyl-CoA:carnitine CoA-transferase CaiB-like acyl-CoA transferase
MAMSGSGSRPLQGIRVLDLTSAIAGPFASLLLGGMGAEVIRIEMPGGGDTARENPPFVGPNGLNFGKRQPGETSLSMLNRGRDKKNISLNLKSPRGRAIFFDLVRQADVIVENMSEGAPTRLGIGYEQTRAHNQAIVYASIRAFGEPSPYPDMKGVDIIVQALSGLMSVTGFADGPPTRIGVPIADLIAPPYAVNGILAALIHRGRTGEGQHVVISLLDCLVSLIGMEHYDMLIGRAGYPMRTGNSMDRIAPFGIFATSDGNVAIAAGGHEEWFVRLAEAIGQPELAADPRFNARANRLKNARAINEIVDSWTRVRSTAEVIEQINTRYSVPTVPVRTPLDVLSDPHFIRSGALTALTHPVHGDFGAVGMGLPIQFSKTRSQYTAPASDPGAANAEIYGGLLDLTEAEMDALRADGVI